MRGKKDISIPSFKINRTEHGGRRSFIRIVVVFSLLLSFSGSLSCKGQKGDASKPKANLPPVLTSVKIFPQKAYKGNELNVSVEGKDPDGGSVTYQYQWIRNDQEMVGEAKNSLRGEGFKKGDLIQVKVVPSDGKEEGPVFLSSPIRILNCPPEIQAVSIEPRIPGVSDSLKAEVKGFDSDGDFVYYTFSWEKNGEVIPEEKGPVLERGQFKKGDSITVNVTPDDRETLGTPKKSEPVLIVNSPPIITSSPPNTIDGTLYRYPVKAHDPDQDPLTFTLRSGPKGMAIDKGTGLIQWEIKKEDKGAYPIEIEVSDSEGAKSTQRYTLAIDFK